MMRVGLLVVAATFASALVIGCPGPVPHAAEIGGAPSSGPGGGANVGGHGHGGSGTASGVAGGDANGGGGAASNVGGGAVTSGGGGTSTTSAGGSSGTSAGGGGASSTSSTGVGGSGCSGPGEKVCPGGCVDTRSSTTDCGMCGNACVVAHGLPACSNSVCAIMSCEPTGAFTDQDGLADDGCEHTEWADWPIPPASPPSSNYTATATTVTDSITGLVWQLTPAAPIDQPTARAACRDLSLAGKSDWRLPSLIELVSLVDYGAKTPAIDVATFPGTPSANFWTSSPFGTSSSVSYSVSFVDGAVVQSANTVMASVRCVRGGL